MDVAQTASYLALGLVQGLTEVLPVSSSGHLALAEQLLGVNPPGISLEIALHAGTLLAVVWFFRRKLAAIIGGIFRGDAPSLRLLLLLVIGSIPAGLAGIAFRHQADRLADSPIYVAVALLVNGLILLSFRRATGLPVRQIANTRAFAIGIAQAIAIAPGISRSGATITVARWLGIASVEAAEFSFLLSIPAVAAANLLELFGHHGGTVAGLPAGTLAGAMLLAAISGYFALWLLMRAVTGNRFWIFGLYSIAAGVSALVVIT